MKKITLTKIGYNAPSGANWAYGIWLVSLIDTDQPYCMSYTVKETFGGDSRFRNALEKETAHKVIEVKGIYTSTGTPKITGVASMLDIESPELLAHCVEFLTEVE